jgi:hypothetical protein
VSSTSVAAIHSDRDAGIPAADRVADSIGFIVIEEHHLIGFGDVLGSTDTVYVGPTIGKDQMRAGDALFGGAATGMTGA